jgi:predicted nucleic acid-binding protein
MKIYFLDTNIILDFLGNRRPFGKYALEIFSHSLTKKIQLWTSANSVTTAYYILEKDLGHQSAKEKIGDLLKYIFIQPVLKEDLFTAIVSKFKDFEDGVQHSCAIRHGKINAIITRNTKDFKNSQIPIISPEEIVF